MVGIISAMQEEVQTLLQELQNVTVTTKGMRKYYTGTLFNKNVVIVFSRWGKVAAAATTTQLINDYKLTELIFTGVAGALDPELNIGDVVVGKHLYQHDMDASPLYKKLEIPLLHKTYFETANAEKLLLATTHFIENYKSYINFKHQQLFSITNPKVIVGNIASGDEFISSKEKIKTLTQLIPTVSCVEMEGAAVAQVCYEYNLPFSIVRIISDKANDNAEIDFPTFASTIASNYALGILKNYLA